MNQHLRRRLDRITDILRAGGASNPVTCIEQVSYLIYLKLLDEEEVPRGLGPRLTAGDGARLFPDQAKRVRWRQWRSRSGNDLRDFVRDEVFPYMGSLVKNEPQVAEYFRDAVLEIVDPNVLKQVVDELDSLKFRLLDPKVTGDILEYLLTNLALHGQFRTPPRIRAFMVQMTDPHVGETIWDPACGTAGFLIDAVAHILARYSETVDKVPIDGEDRLEDRGQDLEKANREDPNQHAFREGAGERLTVWQNLEASIYGTDVSRQMTRIAKINLFLHGIRNARVKRANVLSKMGGLTERDLHRRYQVILSNPPFAGQVATELMRADLRPTSMKSEILFLSLMMRSLGPNGRCAVLVPEKTLFGSSKSHRSLRKRLLREFEVQSVVSLPAGVFKPYSGAKTSVLFFRRPTTVQEDGSATTRHVWFYEIGSDGCDPAKIQSRGCPEAPELNDIPRLIADWNNYKASGFRIPPGHQAGELLGPGTEEPRCWWAGFETVAENDFILAASQYKPRIRKRSPDEDPAVLIREVLAIEREITDGLEKLLHEVARM